MVSDYVHQLQQHECNDTTEYLLLCTDQLMLLLPQSAVSSVRHLNDDDIARIQAAGCVLQGSSHRDGKIAWFAALSDELVLLPTIPKERFLLTTFTDYPDIHWCWRDLYQISGLGCIWFELPKVICTPKTPVHALAVLGEHKAQRCAFLTSAHSLVHFAFLENGE